MKLNFLTNLFKKSNTAVIETTNDNTKSNQLFDEEASKVLIESGKTKAKAKNFRGAIEDFTKAIELDQLNISAYLERSQAKREINDKVGADKDYDKGNRLFQNLDEGLKANDEGNEYYEKSDYKNAIKSYNKAITLIPSVTSIFYYRGYSKKCLNDYIGAIEDFDKCINLNASNKVDAYYQRSKIKSHKTNDKVGALDDLNKAIDIDPNNADYYYSRAILLEDDYDGLQDLNKAVELEPSDANNYLSRSLKRRSMEDYEGSIADITKYIELNPDSYLTISEAYTLRAGIRLLSNDLETALSDHDKAVKADPSNPIAYLDRGIIKNILRDYEGAIVDFNKVLQLDPKNADAFYHRGDAKQCIGLDDGENDIIKAKELGYEE